jgi:hypothetical protein
VDLVAAVPGVEKLIDLDIFMADITFFGRNTGF